MVDSDTKNSPKSRYFTLESLTVDGISTSQVHFIGKKSSKTLSATKSTKELQIGFGRRVMGQAGLLRSSMRLEM